VAQESRPRISAQVTWEGSPLSAASRIVSTSPLPVSSGLNLDLADGQRWLIRPVDDEAASIVAELGKVMRLSPACASGEKRRELCVAVCEEPDGSDRSDAEARGTVVCRLAAPTDRNMRVLQIERIPGAIAREALVRGGLLLHGALAEYRGSGFVLAGPSRVGKSTASRRLPLPWRLLCDDMTLVVRDGAGRFWAHPWPTWSRFRDNGPGGSWAVEHAIPLRAVFFLAQSPSDQLEPVHVTQATALTLESAVTILQEAYDLADEDAARVLIRQGVDAAKALALATPAFSLKLSPDGRFWEKIEGVLPVGDLPGPGGDGHGRDPVSVESLMAGDSLRVVYTGTSMNPTLDEPDLLEVRPYGTTRVRPGDVVCFKSPGTGKTVVHRVVDVGPDGIRTRGDNNPTYDREVLHAGDIIGRVTAVQRGTRRRAILGGWRGLVVLHCVRLGRRIRSSAGLLPHMLYRSVAGLGPLDRMLPASLRPRPVRFAVRYRYRVFLKLLMGRRTIGHYDYRLLKWHIHRPFRLFVGEQTLPDPKSEVQSQESEVPTPPSQ
jgi:SynChlorMet cassette protein ScmC